MKIEFVTIKRLKEYPTYQILEPLDTRFHSVYNALRFHYSQTQWKRKNLIDWLMDEDDKHTSGDYVDINKEHNKIVLYDEFDQYGDDRSSHTAHDLTQRFEMTVKNFAEIVYQWQQLQETPPDIILLVIDEHNHVALETDPLIIKAYQDAGYAFNVHTAQRGIQKYLCFERGLYNHFYSMLVYNVYSVLYRLSDFLIENSLEMIMLKMHKHTTMPRAFEPFFYYDRVRDIVYISCFEWQDYSKTILIPRIENIPSFVNNDNSCTMSYNNFLEILESWADFNQSGYDYFLLYRDEHDWIRLQGFICQDSMKLFLQEYQSNKNKCTI